VESSISEMIGIAVAILLVCIILVAVINMSEVGGQVVDQVNNVTETREILKDYRTYNAYDNTTVKGSEVIALILRTMGNPDIGVQVAGANLASGNGNYNLRLDAATNLPDPLWDADLTAARYSVEQLQPNIDPLKDYAATLVTDAHGIVRIVSFDGA
jgi:hypothetical protein